MEIEVKPHNLLEDTQGLLTGSLFVALAVLLLRQAELVTGGTTGAAFLIYYATGWPLAWVLFAINLPFYAFGWNVLGHAFTIKTFFAVAALSAYIEFLPAFIRIDTIDPLFAAVMGGLLAGTGILMIIRHGGSLGGVTILAIYAQKRLGLRAGVVQMVIDGVILVVAFGMLDPLRVALSLVGAAALNFVIGINHRAGRYFGA
jgi:uncharacterized membrane-anchored protein YitT (DUF2179 family)